MHTPMMDAIVLAVGGFAIVMIVIEFYRALPSLCHMAEEVGKMPLDIDLTSF